jgi:hypothetical protein
VLSPFQCPPTRLWWRGIGCGYPPEEIAIEIRIPSERLLHGDTIFFTFATSGYSEFVRNLQASLLCHDPELASCLVVFCPDDATAAELRPFGIYAVACGAQNLPDFADFLGSGFGRVVSHKYLIARTLLEDVEYAWWCDGDIVLQAPILERVTSLLRQSDADLLMQYEWPKEEFNTGFWVARATPAVKAMLEEMTAFAVQSDWATQPHFNEVHAGREDIRLVALNHDEFMCGNRFYFRRPPRPPAGRLLHFNFTVGRHSKKSLMIGHGHWYLAEPGDVLRRARLRHLLLTAAALIGVGDPESHLRRVRWRASRARGALGRRTPPAVRRVLRRHGPPREPTE